MVLKNIGSKEELDPEIMKIRDDIIAKIGDKPLEEINIIVKKLLNNQMDENTRLGVLAARLKIIRLKIENLYENKLNIKVKPKIIKKVEKQEKIKISEDNESWTRIKLLESTEVNGKQINKDVILDVKKTDGDKLVKQEKAEFVEVKKDKNTNSATLDEDTKVVEPETNLKKEDEKNSLPSASTVNNAEKTEQKTKQKTEQKNDVKNNSLNEKVEKVEENKETVEKKEANIVENTTKDLKSTEPTQNNLNEKKDLLKQHEEKNEEIAEKKETNLVEKTTTDSKSAEPTQDNLKEKKEST